MIRVSTIIPAYNNGATVARAIDSALAQNFEGQEIIVVNDGSTDATSRVLEDYRHKIEIISQPNRGVEAARNAAFATAKGEYIAFLDADDTWAPHKLATTVPLLDIDPRCVLVFSDLTGVDRQGKVIRESMVTPEYAHAPTFEELLRCGWWYIVPSAAVMRRSVLELCGGFDESFGRHWSAGDSFLFLRARELGTFRYIPESLVQYRVSTLIENLRKREKGAFAHVSTRPREQLSHYFGTEDCFVDLAIKYYGKRAFPLIRRMMIQKQWLLLPLAMLAMHDGDRRLARSAYLSLLRHDPLRPQTYARLAWTFIPARMSRRLSGLLPESYQRALMGPPEDTLSF